MRKAFAGSKASYGSPRVHAALIDPALPHPELTAGVLIDGEKPAPLRYPRAGPAGHQRLNR